MYRRDNLKKQHFWLPALLVVAALLCITLWLLQNCPPLPKVMPNISGEWRLQPYEAVDLGENSTKTGSETYAIEVSRTFRYVKIIPAKGKSQTYFYQRRTAANDQVGGETYEFRELFSSQAMTLTVLSREKIEVIRSEETHSSDLFTYTAIGSVETWQKINPT